MRNREKLFRANMSSSLPREDLPIPSENLNSWYRFNSGIIEEGTGVSQWKDASGNERHLRQTVDAQRPTKQVDGSILFNGTSDNLICTFSGRSQPDTMYILMKQVTWSAGKQITTPTEFTAGFAGLLIQTGATPTLNIQGTQAGPLNSDLAVDTYGVVCCVFNGANSVLQVNDGTPETGNIGGGNIQGFQLGASPGATANIEVKEVIIYSAAHDDTTRATIIDYLSGI